MRDIRQVIVERLRQLDWQQKRLAAEWQAKVGKGKVVTYESRLSNLLTGGAEGVAFLIEEPDGGARVAGLAAALGMAADRVRSLVDAERAATTLKRRSVDLGLPHGEAEPCGDLLDG